MAADDFLHIQGLNVRFGGLRALSDVGFDVRAGESIGLIGPNGSGKSTLINVLTRVVESLPGSVALLEGRNLLSLKKTAVVKEGVARTFQGLEGCGQESLLTSTILGAYSYLSVPLLAGLVGRYFGSSLAARSEAERLLEAFSILEWSEAPVAQLPFAVAKRGEICRALMARPKLLLLDEPASGMSASEKGDLISRLLAVKKSMSLTMVIIEHDVGFLSNGLCERLVALDEGRKIGDGDPHSVVTSEAVVMSYMGRRTTLDAEL